MQKKIITAAALGVTALGIAALASHAQENTMSAAGLTQPYVHLYSDAAGVSHFKDEKLAIKAPAKGPASLVLTQSGDATLLALKLGAKEDWHKAPRRMYLIALKGMSEVTAGDGEVRRFPPGSVILMDDTTGKGHITRAVGTEDHIALTVPAPAQ
jgi:hypothetical protein